MTTSPIDPDGAAGAIQLIALAPVFLLTGVASLLNVMAGRLTRIIDRGRELTERPGDAGSPGRASLSRQLQNLEKRRRLTSGALTAATIAALLICVVIAALFLEAMLATSFGLFIGIAFTAASASLIVSLAFFLGEVHLAMQTARFSAEE